MKVRLLSLIETAKLNSRNDHRCARAQRFIRAHYAPVEMPFMHLLLENAAALYLTVFIASRNDPEMTSERTRMQTEGKPFKSPSSSLPESIAPA